MEAKRYRGFAILLFFAYGSCADLPTLYEYYTTDGISSGLSVEQPYFTLNGLNISIYSGAMHYFRIPPQYWQDRLRKLRAAGLNTVETYVPWNLHEPKNGVFDFGNGGSDMEQFLDLERYLKLAQEEDLFVIVRPGPYICAEWEWGGFPSWLLRQDGIQVRSDDSVYMSYVERYFAKLLPLLVKYQFTNRGPIIMVQVENEYGNVPYHYKPYLQQINDLMKNSGIVELLVTSDNYKAAQTGALPGTLFQTLNFGADPETAFGALQEMQPNKPFMAMEFYSGWFDHWSEKHHTKKDSTFSSIYKDIITYPASVNIYMFHGGTNWGFMNGASIGPEDNSGLEPTTTSYDYDAPLTEAGDYSTKYEIIRQLMSEYNPVKTLTPDPPELKERQVYPTLAINSQLNFKDIIEQISSIVITNTVSMEELPINDDSGQSYGYIVYHQDNLDLSAGSSLTISGHVRDTLMVLVNGILISTSLSSSDDFNDFGYWRLENSSITLTSIDLTDVTLDLIFENWGRGNSGRLYHQFKGLADDNIVYLNDQELSSWTVYPLEFKKSWTTSLTGWKSIEENGLEKAPGLYRTILTIDDSDNISDVFIDTQDWIKGIVIVNGFVLGRYAFIGPQQTLYLPGPFLQTGDNEIIFFEHFEPSAEVKFSKDSIFNTP